MCIPSAKTRSTLLKKWHFFNKMGENVHFQPRTPPGDPKFIKFHNNIAVASNVGFITHDIIHKVLNCLPDQNVEYQSHLGCIVIMDKVFIGVGTSIIPNVRIGPNAIVAAKSCVTKDVPPGVVLTGVPARVIGSFDDLVAKRREESKNITEKDRLKRVEPEWEKLNHER